jgi:hypothetical protein
VIVALEFPLNAAVVALKFVEVDEAATVTKGGTVSAALPLDTAILAPPVGAARVRVTVQLLDEFGPKLVGVHNNVETKVAGDTMIVAVAELPL